MPEFVTSTLLTLSGLLALLAALAGTLIWTDGRPVASIPSTKVRVAVGFIGAGLLLAGTWLEYQRSIRVAIPDDLVRRLEDLEELVPRLVELEKSVSTIRASTNEASENVGDIRSQTEQLVKDMRLLALRTSITASESNDANCDNGGRGRKDGRMWISAAGTRCEKTINSVWSIEVVMPLRTSGPALAAALAPLGIPVAINPVDESGSLDEYLAIVFPDEIPHDLICKIHGVTAQTTKRKFSAAIPVSTLWKIAGGKFPSYVVQVGFPLSNFLHGGTKLTDGDWDSLCDKDTTQESFERLLDSKAKTYRRILPKK